MFNFSILILVFLFLISQNFLLLNEEFLILFCFITFCWITFNNLKESINVDFINRSKKIEQSLIDSLNNVEKVLIVNLDLQRKLKNLVLDFKILKKHFISLNKTIYGTSINYLTQNSQAVYLNKFIFIQRLEQQTTKLLALLLSKKLYKIVLIKQFYTQKLRSSNFLCFYKISLREYFEII